MKERLLTTKVLLYERNNQVMKSLKSFIKKNNLHGFRTNRKENIISILESNIDLGCVIICEIDENYLAIAKEIKETRKELPLFIRRKKENIDCEIEDEYKTYIDGEFCIEGIDVLQSLIDKFLFNRYYPSEMVSDIIDTTINSLNNFFKGCTIDCETPYLVKDRIIYGEIFTLISIESSWCRGYMMFETSDEVLDSLIRIKNIATEPGVDAVSSVLGEITNLSWGAFKNKYLASSKIDDSGVKVQVPIFINHMKKYISFGSNEPHLCFKYKLSNGISKSVVLYQKLIFSLKWDPEEYKENGKELNKILEPGSFELF